MKNLFKKFLHTKFARYIIIRLFKRRVVALMQRNGFFVDDSITVKEIHRFLFKRYADGSA